MPWGLRTTQRGRRLAKLLYATAFLKGYSPAQMAWGTKLLKTQSEGKERRGSLGLLLGAENCLFFHHIMKGKKKHLKTHI